MAALSTGDIVGSSLSNCSTLAMVLFIDMRSSDTEITHERGCWEHYRTDLKKQKQGTCERIGAQLKKRFEGDRHTGCL